MIIVINLIFNR